MRVQTDSLLIITLKYYKYIDIFPYELCTITQRTSRDYQSKAWTLCVVGWLVSRLSDLGGRGRRTRRKRLIRFYTRPRSRSRRTYRNNNCSWNKLVYLDTDTVLVALCLESLTAECRLETSLQELDMSAIPWLLILSRPDLYLFNSGVLRTTDIQETEPFAWVALLVCPLLAAGHGR